MKKIDLHCYVTAFPQYAAPHKNGSRFMSAEEQIAFQNKLNIEYSVVIPILSPEGQWTKLGSENCKHISVQHPDRFLWFCGVDPRMGNFRDNTDFTPLLGFFKEKGALGVGEVAPALYIDDPMVDNLFSWCETYAMPALVRYTHFYGWGSGVFDDRGLRRTEAMLIKHPNLRLLGTYDGLWAEYPDSLERLMEKYPNMSAVLSGKAAADALLADPERAASFLERFAAQLCYGTAACSVTDTYPFALDSFLTGLVSSGKLSASAYAKIIRQNAEALLRRAR